MGKSKKRRNKKYTGVDAAIKTTKVTKIKAKQRSKLGEWYVDNKRRVVIWLFLIGLGLVIYGLGRIIAGYLF